MARACSVCAHIHRLAIDAAIGSQTPLRRIAADHGLSEAAVRRHRSSHLSAGPAPSPVTARARETAELAAELSHARELLAEVRSHRDDLSVALARAEARLTAADTAQAELRRLVAQAAGKPLALDTPARTVESADPGPDRASSRWLPWRRSAPPPRPAENAG